jgi:RNA polymerase sigma-70 factor (ECF subfamily)
MLPEPAGEHAALLRAAAAGEPAAVRELLDTVGPVVYGFVFARVGGDEAAAEDIVQETFVEAIRSAATFRGDAALSSWCCAIARRRLARHYESERRAAVVRSGLHAVPAAVPAATADVERRDEMVRALGRLPSLHRQVLVLKYLDDLSVAEIAGQLGRTPVQVQSLLQRARDGLRGELEAGRD